MLTFVKQKHDLKSDMEKAYLVAEVDDPPIYIALHSTWIWRVNKFSKFQTKTGLSHRMPVVLDKKDSGIYPFYVHDLKQMLGLGRAYCSDPYLILLHHKIFKSTALSDIAFSVERMPSARNIDESMIQPVRTGYFSKGYLHAHDNLKQIFLVPTLEEMVRLKEVYDLAIPASKNI